MNPYRNLDLEALAKKINTFSLNLHDYEMVSPTLARVVITYSGHPPPKEEIRAGVTALLNGHAAPVEGSFRQIGDGKAIVGFVYSANDVREYAEDGMKVMASNLLMDNTDKSLWEVRDGSTGKYLVKRGEEDLSELVHHASVRKVGQPMLAQVAFMPTAKREFAAFVDIDSQEVMHGFVVANEDSKITVAAVESTKEIVIEEAQLVEVRNLDDEDRPAYTGMAAEVAADKSAMIQYYRKAYGYDPAYVQMIIQMINQHAFA